MKIHCTAIGRGGESILDHDLNFRSERYEANHVVVRFLTLYTTYPP